MDISLTTLKILVENKLKKKTLIKIMWNDNEKVTLLITPNMKVNSFIYDETDGYLFYDNEGKRIETVIPCILTGDLLINGKIKMEHIINQNLLINNQHLSKEDILFLSEHQPK